MNVDLTTLISVVSAVIALLGLVWTYFGTIVGIEKRLSRVENFNFVEMIERLAKMEVKIGLIWGAIETAAPAIIHHPTTPRKDELLERFPHLTVEELRELKEALNSEVPNLKHAQSSKVLAYALMIARIDSELLDREEEK